jgi:hypothetical protein
LGLPGQSHFTDWSVVSAPEPAPVQALEPAEVPVRAQAAERAVVPEAAVPVRVSVAAVAPAEVPVFPSSVLRPWLVRSCGRT